MEMVTFGKYKTPEEAYELIDLLNSNEIEYQIENIAPSVDITFTGGTEFEDKIAVKIKSEDFKKVDQLFEEIAIAEINLIDKDHYLFDFSNDELVEILENYTEWSKIDFLLARKILKDRGEEISENEIQKFKDEKIE